MKPFRYSTSTLQNFRSKLVFLVAVILLTACDYSDVELRNIREIKIEKLDNRGIEIRGTAHIYNPNSYKIKLQSIDADLYLDGRQAGKAKLLDNVVIPANFDDQMSFRVRTDFNSGSAQLVPIILGATVKRSLNLEVKGTAKAKSFIIGKKFDFDYEHKATF